MSLVKIYWIVYSTFPADEASKSAKAKFQFTSMYKKSYIIDE